jgi:murein DD-endopeptidase
MFPGRDSFFAVGAGFPTGRPLLDFVKRAGCLITIFTLTCVSMARGERPKLYNSLELRMTPRITPAHYNGGWALVYELHVTNCSKTELTLNRLELVEAQSGKVWAVLDGAALTRAIGRMDRQTETGAERKILPGVEVIVYMTVEWPEQSAKNVPLRHRVSYSVEAEVPFSGAVEGGEFVVRDETPVVLQAPLQGGGWAAIYSDASKRGHRRVTYTTDGVQHIPGRFAIDWFKVAPDGTFAKGGDSNPANWYSYGADVLAVSDAIVSMAMDDIPDPQTVDPHKVVEMQNASGNYVVLDLGNGKYAFYEHLKSGSIRVRTGDRVRRGHVLGQVGYTGQATGPHLHFHVADSKMPLNAEGVPYVFQDFKTLGAFSSAEQFDGSKPWTPARAEKHSHELPAPFSVVEFP